MTTNKPIGVSFSKFTFRCPLCVFLAFKQFYCISIWLKVYYIVLK